MSPNRRIFLNIVATYGRSLFALVRVNGVWSDPIDEKGRVVRMECPRDGGGDAAATARGVGNMV